MYPHEFEELKDGEKVEDDIEIVLCGTNENTDMLFTVKANANYYQEYLNLIDTLKNILKLK